MRLRVDDTVLITRGKDRGKTGQIQQIFEKQNKVLVEGINVVSRHTKATGNIRQAGIVQKELPVPVANVRLICPHSSKPVRVGYTRLADGAKARVCKECKEVIE
ncbi:MAG: 50S ribosomal protein L24 [Chloroflexi bacterium]|nr:50S ribosomal protein L24 [Chloroflexota bacterium]